MESSQPKPLSFLDEIALMQAKHDYDFILYRLQDSTELKKIIAKPRYSDKNVRMCKVGGETEEDTKEDRFLEAYWAQGVYHCLIPLLEQETTPTLAVINFRNTRTSSELLLVGVQSKDELSPIFVSIAALLKEKLGLCKFLQTDKCRAAFKYPELKKLAGASSS